MRINLPTPNALHSKKTPKWGTPQWIIEAARELLDGQIHLDPGSSPEFNELVKALMIYTEVDNGLDQPWSGNIFCNPPGGLVREFWKKFTEPTYKAMEGDLLGDLTPLDAEELGYKRFWVGFSVEQLCTLADCKLHPLHFSTCILRKRLNFNQQTEEGIVEGTSPSHGNYVTAIGVDHDHFAKLFQQHGIIIRGSLA